MTKYDVANKEKEAEIHRLKFVEIAEKNKIIEIEKQRSEELLLNIFPAEIAEELKRSNHSEARSYGHVSVMFADMVNFTNVSERLSAIDLVNVLHFYFKNFDIITAKYQIEKIKTIGDCYMCVCGMPTEDEHHAEKIIKAAKEMQQFVESHKNTYDFQFRIGIHSGPLVAGIVGIKKYAYDVWGDTVNTAARLEQNGLAGKINISQTTHDLVKGKFDMEFRGKLPVKNKGDIAMYFVH
ncbi:MAG: adenylate/guanylate cyclase domain-containing protein [Bacteroidetes bacterium]|nr:adenylate/guanylate cyclase domain-containing protein [Bacteroidota bacterium]